MNAYIVRVDRMLRVEYFSNEKDPKEDFIDPVRAEWADRYYPADPPPIAWLENGYSYSCANCEHDVSLDLCDTCQDESEYFVGPPVFVGDCVFCSDRCREEHEVRVEKIKLKKELVKSEFLKRFPSASVVSSWNGGLGHCSCYRQDGNNICLHWTFPGAIGPDHSRTYCGGCKRAWGSEVDASAISKLTNEKTQEYQQ